MLKSKNKLYFFCRDRQYVIDGKSDKSGLVKVCTIHPIDSGLEGEEIYYPNSHNMSGKLSFVFDSTFLALSLKP